MKDKTQNKVDKDKPCVGIVQHEEVTLLKQDYDAMVEREETLRKKLAEHNEYFESLSCKDFNEFQDFISTFMLTPHEEQILIRELKQQLAEKDEEIEKQNRRISLLEKYKNDQKTRANDYYKQCKQADQDKISFAVEQLEKVKEFVNNPLIQKVCGNIPEFRVSNYIDNKIKQLKEK